MRANYRTSILVIVALLLACGPRQTVEHVPGKPPELGALVIEGRAVDLDFAATRAAEVNSGIMKLITNDGDTLLLLAPAIVRCRPGTDGGDAGIGEGEMVRVYLKASDATLARKQYVPVDVAEVQCR